MLCLACCIAFLPQLFRRGTTIYAFLSITSLVTTAYTLFYIPFVNSEPLGLAIFKLKDGRGPVERYIVWLNTAICVLLVLVAWMRSDAADEWWAVWLLPSGEFIIALSYISSFNEC